MKFKRTIAFIIAIAVILPLMCIPSFAATQWDGVTPFEEGGVYYIDKTLTLKKDFTLPKGAKLVIREGGNLLIPTTRNTVIRGTLSISSGGSMTNSGKLNIKSSGVIDVYGTLKGSISGVIKNSGSIDVNADGTFLCSSTMYIYRNAVLVDNGTATLLKSSNVTVSGTIQVKKEKKLSAQGTLTITQSGELMNYGYLSVGKHGAIKNSGVITLDIASGYTRFGVVMNTKNGSFVDKRPVYQYSSSTVAILVDEKDVYFKGIDVSYANGDIEWDKVAASGIDFAMIRAGRSGVSSTSGRSVDTKFHQNISGALANNIDVGVYFYSYATSDAEARADAKFLVKTLKDYKITYPVVLDMEESYYNEMSVSKITSIIEVFFKVLREEGYYPMLYSYKYWLMNNLDMTILDKYAIWLAEIKDAPTYEGGFYIWQYSFTGSVSGIKGDVDLDIAYRDFPAILKKNSLNKLYLF